MAEESVSKKAFDAYQKRMDNRYNFLLGEIRRLRKDTIARRSRIVGIVDTTYLRVLVHRQGDMAGYQNPRLPVAITLAMPGNGHIAWRSNLTLSG